MEYPFKDLMPLDEATARTGYYRDWTHIDADTFHQISELVKFIREKGYGADTREAIAQALERVYHDAMKSGNADMELSMARKHFKDLASRLDAGDERIDSIAEIATDGSPKIFMDSLTQLQDEYPEGASSVALVRETNPPKIYMWNGTEWEDFGAYAEAVLSRATIIDLQESKMNALRLGATETPVNLELEWVSGFVASKNHANGAGWINTSGASGYERSLPYPFKKGDVLTIKGAATNSVLVLSKFSSTNSFLGELIEGESWNKNEFTYVVKDEVEYLSVSNNTTNGHQDAGITLVSSAINPLKRIERKTKFVSPQSIRKPVINFQFDDGLSMHAEFYQVFKSYGFTCGFALPTSSSSLDLFVPYYYDGFEVLSHSTDNEGFSDGTLPMEDAEEKFRLSKEILEDKGISISGWVTPRSQMHEKYLPVLSKYYEYAYTELLGLWNESKGKPYNSFGEDTRRLKRVSLETTSIENIKLAIDKTIEDVGMLSFYAHDYTRGLTPEKLTEILSYIRTKVLDGQCEVLNPYDAYNHYYTLRHSETLASINQDADNMILNNLANVDNLSSSPDTTYYVENNEVVVTQFSVAKREIDSPLNGDVGDKFYASIEMKSNDDSASSTFVFTRHGNSVKHLGSGEWEVLSVTDEIDNTDELSAIRFLESARSGDYSADPVRLRNPILLNLTDIFGAGIEPTKEEMDELIKVTGYIDGEYMLNNKEMLMWSLALIRYNTSITGALGGI